MMVLSFASFIRLYINCIVLPKHRTPRGLIPGDWREHLLHSYVTGTSNDLPLRVVEVPLLTATAALQSQIVISRVHLQTLLMPVITVVPFLVAPEDTRLGEAGVDVRRAEDSHHYCECPAPASACLTGRTPRRALGELLGFTTELLAQGNGSLFYDRDSASSALVPSAPSAPGGKICPVLWLFF